MTLSRRRFIAISAAAIAAAPAAGVAEEARWRGTALGAEASLRLVGLSPAEAAPLIDAARAEIARMERLFSIYRADSALSRLNAAGGLDVPPPELLELLTLCGAIHQATGGAFDPTVQPVMKLLAETRGKPDPDALAAARARIGWEGVTSSPQRIALARNGMALTLNGIAQGYATDRVAALLRARGLRDVLVSVGEIAALGAPAPGRAWRIGVAAPGGPVEKTLSLTDAAVATTAPLGTVFDAESAVGHLVDPRGPRAAPGWRRVTAIGQSAAVADGLSTGCALLAADEIDRARRAFPGYRVLAA